MAGADAEAFSAILEQLSTTTSGSDLRSLVLLTGFVGSGKTTLLRLLAERTAGRGVRVLRSTAAAAEHGIPFEVVRQLFAGVPADTEVERLLRDSGARDAAPARTAADLGAAILDLAGTGPLLIAVDDVHHADLPSLHCLAYLARRLSSAPVLLALTEAPRIRPRTPEAYGELLRAAPVHRIRVSDLPDTEIRAAVAAALGAAAADRLAPELGRLSGGNPLLLAALLEDSQQAGGEAFADAVRNILYRCDPAVLPVARMLAVTGGPVSDPRLGGLLEPAARAALHAIGAATTGGLVVDGRLRHPAVARAVLDGIPVEDRAALHRRVAGQLHRDGAAPVEVARHLAEVDVLSEPWMTRTLLAAAEQGLREGGLEPERRYLRQLDRNTADQDESARVAAALSDAEWQVDPQAAARHLPRVAAEVRAELLRVPVPAAMFHTPIGLGYLQARGRYSVAAGRPDSGLSDFQLCGRLMGAWRMDLPALVPWRTEAAGACLALGRRPQAVRLVRDELARLRPAHVRRRANALRVLAATADRPDRRQLLEEATRLLRESGDRLELIAALVELSSAQQALGDQRDARGAARAAQQLAEECGVPLASHDGRHRGVDASEPATSPADGLSEAETRVAELAAHGHTNREIAARLYVTVGTVEQHLTRIYRKLDLDSRAGLAARLGPVTPVEPPAEPAPQTRSMRSHPHRGPVAGRVDMPAG